MRDTWLVKNFRHVLRRTAPVAQVFDEVPWIWIDIVTDTAYASVEAGVWFEKAPDIVIVTPSNSVFVIEDLTSDRVLVVQGKAITIQGKGILF